MVEKRQQQSLDGFSLLKWLRPRRRSRHRRKPSWSSCSSSSSSSTATVRSFAFHKRPEDLRSAALRLEQCAPVGPFAPGAFKLVERDTSTLPTRHTIQTRYLLHPFNNSFISFDNIPLFGTRKKRPTDTLTSDSSASVTRKVHVKGKRRAPDPPVVNVVVRSRRKRRPAPKPPGSNQDTLSSTDEPMPQVISNDTLVLHRGVLMPKKSEEVVVSQSTKVCTLAPRPWYKRSEATLRREFKDDRASSFEGSLTRFFNRLEDKSKNKRKSGVSILTNISELDKEAAAIVQEEQARNRASMILQAAKLDEEFERRMGANKEIVEEIVNASMGGNSPRRALMSKFGNFGSPKPKLVDTLAAELDDVASGIAKLRRELDQAPRLVEDKRKEVARSRNLASFDREFNRIFSEIDRQLGKSPSVRRREVVEPKIVEIPVQRGTTPKPEEGKVTVVRISGVDDHSTRELKDMLKEMKHSLPKKVSSGVQTSGNLRRVVSPTPRKNENTYVNAVVPAARNPEKTDSPVEGGARWERDPRKKEQGDKLEDARKQYMNTMAVNRLLRKLEAAIASGNHQQAAVLARELAQLKIHCSVVRQRSSGEGKVNLKMYIEDKQAQQGPIPLNLPVNMTVAQLKAKVHIEFEIPANVQRWIIGKNLADNDESTLEELQALDGSPVFLYLVGPPAAKPKEAVKPEVAEKQEDELAAAEPKEQQLLLLPPPENNDEKIHDVKAEIESPGPELEAAAEPVPEARAGPQTPEVKEDKLQRYEELMSLENCDVIATTEPIECPVCFVFTVEGEGVILRDCLHSFCRSCVANVVRYCEEAEVRCPYRDASYTCDSTLQEREIKALVTAEVYQQHLDKSMAQAENNAGRSAFHCKTPDCPGWCIYDDNVNNFLCPVCKVNNCLTCQAIHMGKNCRQYQEEIRYSKDTDHESKRTAAMLEEMVDRGEALPCPTCAVVLMKKWGCDWLRCSMCKTEICWVTRGPRWGPAGKGDTSAGCKCGENGVKCHPRCSYCH